MAVGPAGVPETDLPDRLSIEVEKLATENVLRKWPRAVEVRIVDLDHDPILTDEIKEPKGGRILDRSKDEVAPDHLLGGGRPRRPALANPFGLAKGPTQALERHRDPGNAGLGQDDLQSRKADRNARIDPIDELLEPADGKDGDADLLSRRSARDTQPCLGTRRGG